MGIIRQKWFEVDGDNTLALDWPLDENSHVWEIGGYEGRWAKQIFDKYHSHITIFEPQLWAAFKIQELFKEEKDIDLRPYGLWVKNEIIPIGNYGTDGASVFYDDGRESKQLGVFREIHNEIWNYPHYINLMLMNVEGAEWTLLPAMIEQRTILTFRNFWCQFHPQNEVDHELFGRICGLLEMLGFEIIWDCYPTAVAWRMK